MEKRWHLRRDRKTCVEGAVVTRFGKLFYTRAAETGKAWSPTVDSIKTFLFCKSYSIYLIHIPSLLLVLAD